MTKAHPLIKVGTWYLSREPERGYRGQVLAVHQDATGTWLRVSLWRWGSDEVAAERVLPMSALAMWDLYPKRAAWVEACREVLEGVKKKSDGG